MLGGSAMPSAWNTRPTSPVTWGAQDEVLALMFGFDLLQAVELAQQRAPLGLQSRRGEAIFQRLAQHEREKRTEHVPANGFVGLVIVCACRHPHRGPRISG